MINEQPDEKMGTRGGVRDGAGRKKSLPDGARPTTFKLPEDERIAVKKYIASMRDEAAGKPVVNIDWEAAAFEMVVKMLKPYAYTMIMANGGLPYEKVEKMMKSAAMIAFKDAVSDYEHFHNIR